MDQPWELKVTELEKLRSLALYLELHERKHYRVARHPEQTPHIIRDAMLSENAQIKQQLAVVLDALSPQLKMRLERMQLLDGRTTVRARAIGRSASN